MCRWHQLSRWGWSTWIINSGDARLICRFMERHWVILKHMVRYQVREFLLCFSQKLHTILCFLSKVHALPTTALFLWSLSHPFGFSYQGREEFYGLTSTHRFLAESLHVLAYDSDQCPLKEFHYKIKSTLYQFKDLIKDHNILQNNQAFCLYTHLYFFVYYKVSHIYLISF